MSQTFQPANSSNATGTFDTTAIVNTLQALNQAISRNDTAIVGILNSLPPGIRVVTDLNALRAL